MAEPVAVMTRRIAKTGTNTFIGIPKTGQKPIRTLISRQRGKQTFPIGQLRKFTAATRVCEGTKNNHVCLLGIKGEAYVASKPSLFYFFYKAAQNVWSKPKPRKYGLRTGHRHGHGRDWARIGHERTGHGRARHGRTGHGHGYGTRHGHGRIVSERHRYPLVKINTQGLAKDILLWQHTY
ncbi:unnamed protein product [Sphagnum troendelagicum]|uniref:Ribosomal protein L2 n=1 Tax=Sphagnum troendelagicum TaxID=128251 RepID=A0ABP0TSC2_9BRYO